MFSIHSSFTFCLHHSTWQGFFLLWHSLSYLGVSDLLVDGSRLHLLQRTHNAVLLAPVGLNQGIHSVRVKHDVVGCHQQHPAHCTLSHQGKREGWLSNQGFQENIYYMEEKLCIFCLTTKGNQKHLCCISNWRPNPFETANVLNQVEVIDWQHWPLQCFHLVPGSESAAVQYHEYRCVCMCVWEQDSFLNRACVCTLLQHTQTHTSTHTHTHAHTFRQAVMDQLGGVCLYFIVWQPGSWLLSCLLWIPLLHTHPICSTCASTFWCAKVKNFLFLLIYICIIVK